MAKSEPEEVVEAEVTDVILAKGYAITRPTRQDGRFKSEDTITFSLDNWEGKGLPGKGQIVNLSGVTKFRRGWRAGTALPVRV